MLDIGGAESLVVFVVVTGAMAYGLYWLIRLAVNHGIQDAHLYGRVDQRIGRMQAAKGGRTEAADGVEHE